MPSRQAALQGGRQVERRPVPGHGAIAARNQSVLLQEMSLLPRASLRAEVPTFPTPLKLVFCLHVGTSHAKSGETQLHMLKVAVLSALDYTSLVLVCVTTAAPNSEIAKWLVARGVRVVHHTPAWAPAMRRKVAKIKEAKERDSAFFNISHLYGDPDAMIGTFLRIDLPILGFLDEFVLYVDVDVMFRAEVDWGLILDEVQPTERARLVAANHFAAGKFSFSAPGEPGVGGWRCRPNLASYASGERYHTIACCRATASPVTGGDSSE